MSERPQALDGYQLVSKLGHGGFGEVWYAENAEGRGRAIKLLHPQFISVPEVRGRFEREARILLQLDHPCIVNIEVFSSSSRPYIGMEFLRGSTLREVLEDRALDEAPLHVAQVQRIYTQLCDAMAVAHAHGIVHRDLKPQNIVIVDENALTLKILDFGIASLTNADLHSNTTLGRTIGSRMYMSPEQIRGERASPATDVFALGTLLFELCTLRRPWLRDMDGHPLQIGDASIETGNGTKEVLERIIVGERVAASAYRSELPPAIDDVIRTAWAVNPARRFPDVATLAAAVDAALSGSSHEITAISTQQPTRIVGVRRTAKVGRTLRDVVPFVLTFAAGSLATALALTFTANEASPPPDEPGPVRPSVRASPTPSRQLVSPSLPASPVLPLPSVAKRERRRVRARSPSSTVVKQPNSNAPFNPPRSVQLRRSLRILRRSPSVEGASALADAIVREARGLSRLTERARISEIARISGAVADLDGLEAAIERLEAARNARP